MNKIIELLAKNGLLDDEHIESNIMDVWSIKRILDLNNSLVELVETNPRSKEKLDLNAYSFLANSDMSAQHTSCPEWSCRLRRIDDLCRFSTLYCDRVYIQNYFADYEHPPTNRYEEYEFRYHFAGDLKIMIRLDPIISAGIVQFVPPPEPGFHICYKCAEEVIPTFKRINRALNNQIKLLSKKYSGQTRAKLYRHPYFTESYYLKVHGSDEVWENGEVLIELEELPPPLAAKVQNVPNAALKKGIQLTRREIGEAGIVENSLQGIANDIWMQYFMSRVSGMNLKYLTYRDIDISFLQATTKDNDFKKYNNILKSRLIYELPILNGIPLDSLLDIRRKEHDAFLLYRDGINEIINNYISQRKSLSDVDAREVYEDIVMRWSPNTGQVVKVGFCS